MILTVSYVFLPNSYHTKVGTIPYSGTWYIANKLLLRVDTGLGGWQDHTYFVSCRLHAWDPLERNKAKTATPTPRKEVVRTSHLQQLGASVEVDRVSLLVTAAVWQLRMVVLQCRHKYPIKLKSHVKTVRRTPHNICTKSSSGASTSWHQGQQKTKSYSSNVYEPVLK